MSFDKSQIIDQIVTKFQQIARKYLDELNINNDIIDQIVNIIQKCKDDDNNLDCLINETKKEIDKNEFSISQYIAFLDLTSLLFPQFSRFTNKIEIQLNEINPYELLIKTFALLEVIEDIIMNEYLDPKSQFLITLITVRNIVSICEKMINKFRKMTKIYDLGVDVLNLIYQNLKTVMYLMKVLLKIYYNFHKRKESNYSIPQII